MTTELLQEKTGRYLRGLALPSEKNQIQAWLSCTGKKDSISMREKEEIENEILAEVKAYTDWSSFQPKTESWWKKVTAFF